MKEFVTCECGGLMDRLDIIDEPFDVSRERHWVWLLCRQCDKEIKFDVREDAPCGWFTRCVVLLLRGFESFRERILPRSWRA